MLVTIVDDDINFSLHGCATQIHSEVISATLEKRMALKIRLIRGLILFAARLGARHSRRRTMMYDDTIF